ncbi:hypothetical protein ACJX0J_035036 [Zea mays]
MTMLFWIFIWCIFSNTIFLSFGIDDPIFMLFWLTLDRGLGLTPNILELEDSVKEKLSQVMPFSSETTFGDTGIIISKKTGMQHSTRSTGERMHPYLVVLNLNLKGNRAKDEW